MNSGASEAKQKGPSDQTALFVCLISAGYFRKYVSVKRRELVWMLCPPSTKSRFL
jgi:hypothetical protein